VQPAEASPVFAGLVRVHAEAELRLGDRTLERVIDLRREGTCRHVKRARLVRLEIARSGRVTLEVYELAGRRLRTLVDGNPRCGAVRAGLARA
jgi:hypothetical protein